MVAEFNEGGKFVGSQFIRMLPINFLFCVWIMTNLASPSQFCTRGHKPRNFTMCDIADLWIAARQPVATLVERSLRCFEMIGRQHHRRVYSPPRERSRQRHPAAMSVLLESGKSARGRNWNVKRNKLFGSYAVQLVPLLEGELIPRGLS